MLELILRGLEKLSSYVVRFLLWVGVVGISTSAVSSQDTKLLIEQNAGLPGETDEAIRWLEELAERNKNMPEERIYIKLNDDEELLKALKARYLDFDMVPQFRYEKHQDKFDPFDPERYRCNLCGRYKVRLWRRTRLPDEANNEIELLCAFCLGDVEGILLRGSKDLGKNITKSSTILYYFPAIPMMNGEEYLSSTTIRNATNDNALVNEWLKMDD